MQISQSIRPVTLHITVDRIVIEQTPAAAPAQAAAHAPARARVRPRMYGNEMFYVPERAASQEHLAPARNPLADFFNWLFGYSTPQA